MRLQSKRLVIRRSSSVAIACLAFVVAGCADLSAIREFASTSAATADYKVIIDDYVTMPKRIRAYSPSDEQERRDQQAKERESQREALLAVQSTLVVYMDTIGKLAAEDLPSIDAELKTLKGSLDKVPFSNAAEGTKFKETVGAAQTILGILGKWAINGFRQAKLNEVIRDADPHVQALVKSLDAMLDDRLGLDTELELGRIEVFFDNGPSSARAIAKNSAALLATLPREGEAGYKRETAEAATKLSETVSLLPEAMWSAVAVQRLEATQSVTARQSDLTAYRNVLAKIAKGHAELRAHAGQLSDKRLFAEMKTYATDLKELYKLFGALRD